MVRYSLSYFCRVRRRTMALVRPAHLALRTNHKICKSPKIQEIPNFIFPCRSRLRFQTTSQRRPMRAGSPWKRMCKTYLKRLARKDNNHHTAERAKRFRLFLELWQKDRSAA
jgi:hypothetical protein